MGVLVHQRDAFDTSKRSIWRLDRPVTVRRLVQRHKGLRPYTRVCRPGGAYGRRQVREFSRSTVCRFNDRWLTRAQWKRTVVGPDDVVAFLPKPPEGGGGVLRIVLAIAAIAAVTVLTAGIGGALFGAAGTAGLIGAGGALFGSTLAAGAVSSLLASAIVGAVSYGLLALFAQPSAPSAGGTGYANATPASSPVYNLTAQGNFARLNQVIPEPLGRNRLFPDFVASPYVRYEDYDAAVSSSTDQYLHHIVGLGIGEFEIDTDSLKLGDTPLSSYEDIEYYVIEPGELSDTDIADERWITSADLADIELLDSDEGSPWAGPYAANPAGTTIGTIEIDVGCPRGLWAYNPVSTGLDGREVTFEYEAQEIDDLGIAVGDPDVWETFDPITFLRTSQDYQRVTIGPVTLPTAGRWQVRLKRTDAKDTSLQAGHQLNWIGLRGRVIGRRTFDGMTAIALRMKAGAALNSAQSRRFNLVATRKLETWDPEAGAMTTVRSATRSPCDAYAYIARTSNGGRLRDDQIALAELYDHKEDFEEKGWSFDFVFDGQLASQEQLARVAGSVVAVHVTQGNKAHLVRDLPSAAPVAMVSPRNIIAGSFGATYAMPDGTAPDCLTGSYIDQRIWQPLELTVAFDDSAQERPSQVTLYGVGNREQAWAVLWNLWRSDRYRRAPIAVSVPAEGQAVTFGDGISFSHDVPNYGQTLEVIDYDDTDPNAPIFTCADNPSFGSGTHYAAVRDSLGRKAGPFVATKVSGQTNKLKLTVPDPGDLPEILIGGDKERTWVQFGPGEAYAKPLKVKQVTPRDQSTFGIVAFYDDPRVYDPLPDLPDVPIGIDTPDLVISITNDDGPTVNLRAKANENDYTGLAAQKVTFTKASDVDVAIVRGSWPVGAPIFLEMEGNLSGITGAAGAAGIGGTPAPAFEDPGDGLPGTAGGPGGTALDSSTGPLTITGAGTIRGGKGGGGGGGGGGGSYYEVVVESLTTGHLVQGGDGGAGNGGTGETGTSEGPVVSGNGGNGGASAGSYATAGAAGSSGTSATGGIWNGEGGAGGAGGAAGKAIVGVANVDLTGFTGSIVGTTV
ncbi:host specificity factor TipJ family phage tail protein [Reyranella sp.]|uniref:host specificity factor TipJ family phage tail protein n=1 Tax=Reyranella sp. TaxID=1929291 RepID=UPI003D09FE93